MRIAIEASAVCTPHPTGVSRYTASLVTALLELRRRGETVHELRVCYRLSRWQRRRHRLRLAGLPSCWYQEPLLPPLRRPELVHGTDLRVPNWRGVSKVATLHDVFALLSDKWSPPGFRARKIAAYKRTAERADLVIAVSESSRRDFLAQHDCPPERLRVVHEGVGAEFAPSRPDRIAAVLARHGLERPYLLFVGGADRRKNLLGLMRALAGSTLGKEFLLAVVGEGGYGAEAVWSDPATGALGDRLRRLGYLPDEDLPALYAGAAAFCFPSHYEGFGLPLLEAMACGTPVMAARRGALPEVAGGHAALADPEDPEQIAAAIARTLDTDRDALDAAREHARSFTWERCARETLAVYEELLKQRS